MLILGYKISILFAIAVNVLEKLVNLYLRIRIVVEVSACVKTTKLADILPGKFFIDDHRHVSPHRAIGLCSVQDQA
jgi:hypothetical protein